MSKKSKIIAGMLALIVSIVVRLSHTNKTNNMKTSIELREEKNTILSQIRNIPFSDRINRADDYDKLCAKLEEVERLEKTAKLRELVERVNREQSELRESGAMVYKVEQPGVDITTNYGEFHATKVKKYPNIQALGKYTSAKFSTGGTMYEVRNGPKRWTLAVNRAKYGEPEKYEFFATFEEFLSHNGVLPQPLTVADVERVIEANERAIEKMREAEKEFSAAKDALNLYTLSNVGLFSQSLFSHVHEYRVNI